MRNLTIFELTVTAGGGVSDAATTGAAIGGGVGVSVAVSSGATGTAVAGMAAIGAATGAALGAAGALGYAGGQWINENTGIQGWIADTLDKIFDPSGTDYN